MPTVRQATLEDLDRIYEIVAAAFGPFCAAKLLEDEFGVIDGKSWVEHKAGSVVDACRGHMGCVIVAEEEGQVVGFASFGCKGDLGMVGNNAVDPRYQGRGIGTLQIRRVLEIMRDRGVTRFCVTTMAHDRPARRVYEKLGFRECRRSAMWARRKGRGVKQLRLDAANEEEHARAEGQGYRLIARSVQYEMGLADLASAEARLAERARQRCG